MSGPGEQSGVGSKPTAIDDLVKGLEESVAVLREASRAIKQASTNMAVAAGNMKVALTHYEDASLALTETGFNLYAAEKTLREGPQPRYNN